MTVEWLHLECGSPYCGPAPLLDMRMEMPTLVIHLGLAKTASTSLQRHFFPQVRGYLGKEYAEGEALELPETQVALADELELLFRYGHGPESLARWAKQLDFRQFPSILISNESFSCWRVAGPETSSWPVQAPRRGEPPRRGRHPIVSFLIDLQSVLDSDVRLITILTLRAPATYLPSHAAQARAQSLSPIVRRIQKREDPFILWGQFVSDLTKLRGPDQHLTLLFEDGVEQNARMIAKFCGLTPKSRPFRFGEIFHENRRRIEGASWRARAPRVKPDRVGDFLFGVASRVSPATRTCLGKAYRRLRANVAGLFSLRKSGRPRELRLTEAERSQVKAYTQRSTQLLSDLLGRDLRQLGY